MQESCVCWAGAHSTYRRANDAILQERKLIRSLLKNFRIILLWSRKHNGFSGSLAVPHPLRRRQQQQRALAWHSLIFCSRERHRNTTNTREIPTISSTQHQRSTPLLKWIKFTSIYIYRGIITFDRNAGRTVAAEGFVPQSTRDRQWSSRGRASRSWSSRRSQS